jgi:hypothetical protein
MKGKREKRVSDASCCSCIGSLVLIFFFFPRGRGSLSVLLAGA